MDDVPKIIFWSQNVKTEYPKIEPAEINRDWMDKSYNKLAYICTPLVAANSNGWEIKLPQDVVVKWNGISEGIEGEMQNNVQILSGEFYNNVKIATTETGVGSITFTFHLVPQTDPDHYLIISGPPNYIFKWAEPLTGLLRTDQFMDHPLQITWKINTSDEEIIFPKGMPICFITIHKKNIVEQTEVEIRQVNKEKDPNDHRPPLYFGMQLIIGYLNETEEDFQKTLEFVEEFRDCISEVITCSAFLIHAPLQKRWIAEGQYLNYVNGVNFSTIYNTPMDRLDRLDRAEALFKRINLPYSIYNRGLYADLKEKGELGQIGEEFNKPIVESEPIVEEPKVVMIERPMIESVIEYVMESIIEEPVVVERPRKLI